MTKIPVHEVALAAHMIQWFARGSGETDIASLAAMHGLDEHELYAWAKSRDMLFKDTEVVSMSVLPFIWTHFAPVSRICQALRQALVETCKTDSRVADWGWLCEKEINGSDTPEQEVAYRKGIGSMAS